MRSLRQVSLLYFSSTSWCASSHSDWLIASGANVECRALLKPWRNACATSSQLPVEGQGVRARVLVGITQQREELGGAIVERQRALLEQRAILPHLCAANKLEAAAGEIGLR